jgi:hypothetical protein
VPLVGCADERYRATSLASKANVFDANDFWVVSSGGGIAFVSEYHGYRHCCFQAARKAYIRYHPKKEFRTTEFTAGGRFTWMTRVTDVSYEMILYVLSLKGLLCRLAK